MPPVRSDARLEGLQENGIDIYRRMLFTAQRNENDQNTFQINKQHPLFLLRGSVLHIHVHPASPEFIQHLPQPFFLCVLSFC